MPFAVRYSGNKAQIYNKDTGKTYSNGYISIEKALAQLRVLKKATQKELRVRK